MHEPFWFRSPFSANISHLDDIGMPEVHLTENWRKSPSWYHTGWRAMPSPGS